MTTYLLAGGGTAGHVNPLLALADLIREREPESTILVLGTAEGLEARLVPLRGYELLTVPKLPFPRRPNAAALRFPAAYRRMVARVRGMIRDRGVDVVVGFGGYAAAPAYSAARRERVPIVVHEANARPGLANRRGAQMTRHVGIAFHGTPLRNGRFVGMPLRPEITRMDRGALRLEAAELFGLDPDVPTVLVTGGSMGARRVNETVFSSRADIVSAGAQILHIQGGRAELADPVEPGYRLMEYCDRMDAALAIADLAVSRSGASTVSELSAMGVPAVYVPYPVGNGEQRFNARDAVDAGGALLVDDADFTPEWVRTVVVPLVQDKQRLLSMSERAAGTGTMHGSELLYAMVREALGAPTTGDK